MFESFNVLFSATSSDIINEVQPVCEVVRRSCFFPTLQYSSCQSWDTIRCNALPTMHFPPLRGLFPARCRVSGEARIRISFAIAVVPASSRTPLRPAWPSYIHFRTLMQGCCSLGRWRERERHWDPIKIYPICIMRWRIMCLFCNQLSQFITTSCGLLSRRCTIPFPASRHCRLQLAGLGGQGMMFWVLFGWDFNGTRSDYIPGKGGLSGEVSVGITFLMTKCTFIYVNFRSSSSIKRFVQSNMLCSEITPNTKIKLLQY